MPEPKAESKPESKADTLLHPIRMRLVQALARSGPMTPQQLGEALADVPQASLYRHLQRLAEAGLLEVVEERKVRGAKERTYALPAAGAVLGASDLASATHADHQRYFTTFVASLLGDFARYLDRPTIDMAADGVGYRTLPLHLTDAEFAEMARAFGEALRPYLANRPGPGRRARHFSTIVMPVEDRPAASDA